LYDGNLDLDCERFNRNLTEWLIEYNFNRPHKSLDYLTPMEYIEKELPKIRNPAELLPMWSARTRPCVFSDLVVS
ncbi:MAG: integrase core domain-containing protein, partial [Candidatus Omnitrophica bacterium]|nr:integrase core domain-containing protein [Candidatus Omnitrophota bacterium]